MLRILPPTFEPVLQKIKVARPSFVDGKTRNIAIQLDLQQSCKRVCTFFVTRFTAPQESLHKWDKIFKIVIFSEGELQGRVVQSWVKITQG